MAVTLSIAASVVGCSGHTQQTRDFRTIPSLGAAVREAGVPCTNPRGGPDKVSLNIYYCGPSDEFTKLLLKVYPDHPSLIDDLNQFPSGSHKVLYGTHWSVFADESTLLNLQKHLGGTLR